MNKTFFLLIFVGVSERFFFADFSSLCGVQWKSSFSLFERDVFAWFSQTPARMIAILRMVPRQILLIEPLMKNSFGAVFPSPKLKIDVCGTRLGSSKARQLKCRRSRINYFAINCELKFHSKHKFPSERQHNSVQTMTFQKFNTNCGLLASEG